MNKRIKKKKEKFLMLKMGFTKEEYTYCKKYPRLYVFCTANKISKKEVDRLYNSLKDKYTKDEFQIYYKIYLINPCCHRGVKFENDMFLAKIKQ